MIWVDVVAPIVKDEIAKPSKVARIAVVWELLQKGHLYFGRRKHRHRSIPNTPTPEAPNHRADQTQWRQVVLQRPGGRTRTKSAYEVLQAK
jgi:hypothetical protein